MRTLLLLRGIQASGKSTWIKENNLEAYTLSADNIRLNIANPVLLEDGSYEISQKYNKVTWELLYRYGQNNALQYKMPLDPMLVIHQE